MRLRHYSLRTEEAYVGWIRRYILFHGKRHPNELDENDVSAFLSSLAINGRVAAATQNQALNALLFLYKEVLQRELGFVRNALRVKRPPKAPVVLSPEEVRAVLSQMNGQYRLMAQLLYGSGIAFARVSPVARQRCRSALSAHYGARSQRRSGPKDDAPGGFSCSIA